jgi:acetolactate synthase-1/2/3 large subunit
MNNFLSADGPCLLEVVTDREEGIYPLIPQGKGYRDMILGPYIREIEA